jgi:hypothetical protein
MSLMSAPRFTAEASIYKTSGHYRAGRYIDNPFSQTVRPVWPSAIREDDGEGEVIDVCKDDPFRCLPPPLTEPPVGGGGGPPSGGGPFDNPPGGGGGSGSGNGGKPPKGQDKDIANKNCELVQSGESSKFGKCNSVCNDKLVTKDSVNKRWVCCENTQSAPHKCPDGVGYCC